MLIAFKLETYTLNPKPKRIDLPKPTCSLGLENPALSPTNPLRSDLRNPRLKECLSEPLKEPLTPQEIPDPVFLDIEHATLRGFGIAFFSGFRIQGRSLTPPKACYSATPNISEGRTGGGRNWVDTSEGGTWNGSALLFSLTRFVS